MLLYSQNKVAFFSSIDGSLLLTKLSSKFMIVGEPSNKTVNFRILIYHKNA